MLNLQQNFYANIKFNTEVYFADAFTENSTNVDNICVSFFLNPPDTIFDDSDTLHVSPDTLDFYTDSVIFTPDTLAADSLFRSDTKLTKSENAIDATVNYNARDSIDTDVVTQKVFLYGEAEILYQEFSLQADYIEIDFKNNIIIANGIPDSAGIIQGRPVFTEGGQSFKSESMKYNYKTKKGLISGVFTEDGYGYLHGKTVKTNKSQSFDIGGGSYTTCEDEDHPHFEFKYKKSRVVPNKRIVTGPAYLSVEGAPIPIGIPFGWFPAEQGKKNGILIPTYGESANRGFYFENGGYYFSVGEHLDFTLLGDIYTKGSWAVKPTMRYRKRYKYNGNFNFSYANNIEGVKGSDDYSLSKDFSIVWSHRQDKTARPNSTFSASVNIKSSDFNKYVPSSTQDYLSNTYSSSIAYQTSFGGKYFLTINASHNQNTQSKVVNVTLPELSFNANQFYPFQAKSRTGKQRWYEKIAISYAMNARNKVSAPDSLFFTENTFKNSQNGIRHAMPISSPLKIAKFLTWTNSINLNDRMYFQSYNQYWVNDTLFDDGDTTVGYVVKDTIRGFNNLFDFSFSSSISTRLFGMYQFGNKFPINAIRHVLTPTLSFSYTPDFGSDFWGYYDSYTTADGEEIEYSKYEGAIYGVPPPDKSGRISFALKNNLEMKVRSRKDTITGFKKVVLIEDFTISTSWDIAKDSLNLAPVIMSGRTTLFKKLRISYNSSWDPYIIDPNDSTGNRNLDQFEWTVNRRLLRLDNTRWTVALSWRISASDFEKDKKFETDAGTEAELEEINMDPDNYIDWTIPWNLSFNYTFNYTANHLWPDHEHQKETNIVQTFGVSGDVSLTPKWKILFRTGWDFESNDLSYTSISITRDLHCWEMRFNWIPTGYRKSWNFSINAKASILQDLKLSKKKDWRDY